MDFKSLDKDSNGKSFVKGKRYRFNLKDIVGGAPFRAIRIWWADSTNALTKSNNAAAKPYSIGVEDEYSRSFYGYYGKVPNEAKGVEGFEGMVFLESDAVKEGIDQYAYFECKGKYLFFGAADFPPGTSATAFPEAGHRVCVEVVEQVGYGYMDEKLSWFPPVKSSVYNSSGCHW